MTPERRRELELQLQDAKRIGDKATQEEIEAVLEEEDKKRNAKHPAKP